MQADLDNDGFLRLHGHDIPAQPPFVQSEHGRTAHIVAKSGAKTGLTFGITNEIEAVRRILFESETSEPVVAFHMLVVDLDGGNFSRPGDSGACVFDTTGRAVGVVDTGVASSKVMEYMRKYKQGDETVHPDVATVPDQNQLPAGFIKLTRNSTLGIIDNAPGVSAVGSESGDGDTAKAAEPASIDVTFVTPIQWVMEDVRHFTECEPEIISAWKRESM